MDFRPVTDVVAHANRGKFKKALVDFIASGHQMCAYESTKENIQHEYQCLTMIARSTRPSLPVRVSRRGLTIYLIRTDMEG